MRKKGEYFIMLESRKEIMAGFSKSQGDLSHDAKVVFAGFSNFEDIDEDEFYEMVMVTGQEYSD